MVTVRVWGSLRGAVGGRDAVQVEAGDAGELLRRLADDYPGLRPQLERGVSLAIDGHIYRNAWFTPLAADSEVVLMPRMAGG